MMNQDDPSHLNRREWMLATSAGAASLLLTHPVVAKGKTPLEYSLGRAQAFNLDWRFHRGRGTGFEVDELDDSDWREL